MCCCENEGGRKYGSRFYGLDVFLSYLFPLRKPFIIESSSHLELHGAAEVCLALSQLQVSTYLIPVLTHVGFLKVFWFLSTSQNIVVDWLMS